MKILHLRNTKKLLIIAIPDIIFCKECFLKYFKKYRIKSTYAYR